MADARDRIIKRLAFAIGLRLLALFLVYLPFHIRAEVQLFRRRQRFLRGVDAYEAAHETKRRYPFGDQEPYGNAADVLAATHWFLRYRRDRFSRPEGFEDLPPQSLGPDDNIPLHRLGFILFDSLDPDRPPSGELENARLYGDGLIAIVERAVRCEECDWRFEVVDGGAWATPPLPTLRSLAYLMAYRAAQAPRQRSIELGLEIYALAQDLRRHAGPEVHREGGAVAMVAFDSLRRSLARCPRSAELQRFLADLEALGPPVAADLRARRLVMDAAFALRSGATLKTRKGCFRSEVFQPLRLADLFDLSVLIERDWRAFDATEERFAARDHWPLDALRRIQAREPSPWVLDYAGLREEQLRVEIGCQRPRPEGRGLQLSPRGESAFGRLTAPLRPMLIAAIKSASPAKEHT